MLAGSFPNVACGIDKLVPHFHIRILQPEGYVLEVYCNSSLEYGARPSELAYAGLPFGIFQPGAHVVFLHAQRVLKVLPHAVLVVVQLVRVSDPHFGWLVFIKLVLNRLSNELL